MNLADYKVNIQQPLRQATLCFLVTGDQILLALKKRGFGKDRWNGVGGKPKPDETIEQAAIRETEEEIKVIPRSMRKRAVLDFYFPHNHDWNQQVVVYWIEAWDGKPEETEEMKPQWFNLNELPFDSMWPDDKHWLPKVIAGLGIKAEFLFGEGDLLLDFSVSEVEV